MAAAIQAATRAQQVPSSAFGISSTAGVLPALSAGAGPLDIAISTSATSIDPPAASGPEDDAMEVDTPLPITKASRPRATMLMDGPVPSVNAVAPAARKRRASSPDATIASALGATDNTGRPRVVLNAQFARMLGMPSAPSARRLLRRTAAPSFAPAVAISTPIAVTAPDQSATTRLSFGVRGAAQAGPVASPAAPLAHRLRSTTNETSPGVATKRKMDLLEPSQEVRVAKQIRPSPVTPVSRPTAPAPPQMAIRSGTPVRSGDYVMPGVETQAEGSPGAFAIGRSSSLLERLGKNPASTPTYNSTPARPPQDALQIQTPSGSGLSLMQRLGGGNGGAGSTSRAPGTSSQPLLQQGRDTLQGHPARSITASSSSLLDRLGNNGPQPRQPSRVDSNLTREAFERVNRDGTTLPPAAASPQPTSAPLLARFGPSPGGSPAPNKTGVSGATSNGQRSLLDRLGNGAAQSAKQTPIKAGRQPAKQPLALGNSSPLSLAARLAPVPTDARGKR